MIPFELRSLPNWVIDGGKVPYNPYSIKGHRELYGHYDPATWGTYEGCKRLLQEHQDLGLHIFDGLGFALSKDAGIIVIDIDEGVNKKGKPNKFAKEIIDKFHSYTEWSVHKRGFHIFVKGVLDADKYHNFSYGIEICSAGWSYLITDDPYLDTPVIENQDAIDWLVNTYIDKEKDREEIDARSLERVAK